MRSSDWSSDVCSSDLAALPRVDGQAHDFIAADVSRTDALRESIAALVARAPVHILVNNTGGPPGGAAHEAPVDAYLDAFNKHLVANQTLLHAVAPGTHQGPTGRAAGRDRWGQDV